MSWGLSWFQRGTAILIINVINSISNSNCIVNGVKITVSNLKFLYCMYISYYSISKDQFQIFNIVTLRIAHNSIFALAQMNNVKLAFLHDDLTTK